MSLGATRESPSPGRSVADRFGISPGGLGVGVALLVGVLIVRAVTSQLDPAFLPDAVRDFFTLSISVVVESLPFVFLGIVFSAIVQVWLPAGLLLALLPRRGVLRRASVSGLGVVLPVCECGNVPLARGFVLGGMSVPDTVTFLLAAPLLNPVTIVTTYQAFGWGDDILIGRILGGFLIANFVGWIFTRHSSPSELLTPRFEESCRTHGHEQSGRRWGRSVELFARETTAVLPALFVGSAVAGAIQVGVPRSLLITIGANPVWSVLVLMLLAFVVAICSNVDAFFALALGSSFMPGAIVAFLVFGAMVDIKMVALLRTTFTTRAVVDLTVLVMLSTLVLGLGVNLVA
jgi:uncharacterized membrane protein YraQ (UPF0718 family)